MGDPAPAVIRVEPLPDPALDAAAAFHARWADDVHCAAAQGREFIVVVLNPAPFDHADWRRAAARDQRWPRCPLPRRLPRRPLPPPLPHCPLLPRLPAPLAPVAGRWLRSTEASLQARAQRRGWRSVCRLAPSTRTPPLPRLLPGLGSHCARPPLHAASFLTAVFFFVAVAALHRSHHCQFHPWCSQLGAGPSACLQHLGTVACDRPRGMHQAQV